MRTFKATFHNKIANVDYTVRARVYKSLSGFRRMHIREEGFRAPDRLSALSGVIVEDSKLVFTMDFHEPYVGGGCVAHEALHVALDVYRMITKKDDVVLKVGTGTGNYDLLGYEEYIKEPEEMLCDIIGAVVKWFWNEWNE